MIILNTAYPHLSSDRTLVCDREGLLTVFRYLLPAMLIAVIVLMRSTEIQAQAVVKVKKTFSPVKNDTSYFLDEWVIESSIKLTANNHLLPAEWWKLDRIQGTVSLEIPGSYLSRYGIDSLTAEYEILPLVFSRTSQRRKPLVLDTALFANQDSLAETLSNNRQSSAFRDSDLTQSGSLSRGIIVGTNQDFALESGLNFELNGKLTEKIDINASLTDQSIPIQPDGTTQNLKEFDRVLIQLQAPFASVAMGDVDISLEQNTFARLNRRLQGAKGTVRSSGGYYSGAVSAVRGTYKSISINGSEGVQGPYRLTGRDNEKFVIILAGTESVYLNGQLLKRGAENDYIIDYGLGELTFTSNTLIKDESRIVVEYEYVDQNFNRTLVAAEGTEEFLDGKLKIGATVIRQADGNDLLSQQTLSQDDVNLLETVGDNLEEAQVSGAVIADKEERENYVLYARVDTSLNGETYAIYKHVPGSEDAIYRVRFTNAGEGKGSYKRTGGSVNGLLYEWVGPGMGAYAPFRNLPAPQKQQAVAFKSSYQLSDKVELFGEWAVSDFDQNRFSSLDDEDNVDMAYNSGIRISKIKSAIGSIDGLVRRRYSGRRFQFFERSREVEFDRKWNINRKEPTAESINEVIVSVSPSAETSIGGEFGFVEHDNFIGYRQAASVSSNEPGVLNVIYNQDWVKSENDLTFNKGNWFRQQGDIAKDFGKKDHRITPFISFEQEKRLQKDMADDTLSRFSFSFYDVGTGARLLINNLELEAGVGYRVEKGVLGNVLQDQSAALEYRYGLNYKPGAHFSTQNEIKVRDKTFTDEFLQEGNSNRKGLLLKSITTYQTANKEVEGEFFYQANTQRRSLFQETYIEVGPEIGQYVWDDNNADGVQQVDEFFPEVSVNEGTFIRQLLPSDKLFPVVDLNVRMTHSLRPFQLLTKNSESIWSEMVLHSRVDVTENSTTEKLEEVYLLKLNTFRNDTSTIEGRIFWEKELDVLPTYGKADLKVGYRQNRSMNQRSTELIRTYTDLLYLHGAYNLSERIRLKGEVLNGLSRNISNRLQNRNFDIHTFSVSPGIEATLNRSWSTTVDIAYSKKEDRFPTQPVRATTVKISNTQRAYLWKQMQARLKIELRNTSLSGNSSAYGSYELTDGSGEGTNLIWSLNTSYRVSNLIRMNLNYDGRTLKNDKTIHTIKLVMSALF
ncbi:MAG: hypothetical protein FH748_03685 [Balneolaceae bacterium]|nr:hypothetical protein [Balneolaceae bacterium]